MMLLMVFGFFFQIIFECVRLDTACVNKSYTLDEDEEEEEEEDQDQDQEKVLQMSGLIYIHFSANEL